MYILINILYLKYTLWGCNGQSGNLDTNTTHIIRTHTLYFLPTLANVVVVHVYYWIDKLRLARACTHKRRRFSAERVRIASWRSSISASTVNHTTVECTFLIPGINTAKEVDVYLANLLLALHT